LRVNRFVVRRELIEEILAAQPFIAMIVCGIV